MTLPLFKRFSNVLYVMHLQKKRGSLYLLPVPRIEAFALPGTVERATQKPTPICIYAFPCMLQRNDAGTPRVAIKYTRRASIVAMSLTVPEVCEVSMRQGTKRLINAFPLYAVPAPSASQEEASARKHCKNNERPVQNQVKLEFSNGFFRTASCLCQKQRCAKM